MGSTSKFWTKERIAKLRDMAADGMTKREAADFFGLPYQNVHYQTRVNRIEFRGSELTRRKDPSNRFFRARWESGYTVEEAAEKIGISDDTLRDWERGDSLPRDAFTRDCAAEVYGVDPQSLCTDEELEARDRKSRSKAAETWSKRKEERQHGYRDVEGAVRGERGETEGGSTSVELVQEAGPGGRAEEAADDRRERMGADRRLCGGVDRGGGQMIRVKVKDENPGAYKLPEDVGVPEALRPKREMTTEEKNNHFSDMEYFTALHIKRSEEARKKKGG